MPLIIAGRKCFAYLSHLRSHALYVDLFFSFFTYVLSQGIMSSVIDDPDDLCATLKE